MWCWCWCVLVLYNIQCFAQSCCDVSDAWVPPYTNHVLYEQTFSAVLSVLKQCCMKKHGKHFRCPLFCFAMGKQAGFYWLVVVKNFYASRQVCIDNVCTAQPAYMATPAGMLDGNGDFSGAMAREMEEETGIKCNLAVWAQFLRAYNMWNSYVCIDVVYSTWFRNSMHVQGNEESVTLWSPFERGMGSGFCPWTLSLDALVSFNLQECYQRE